MSILHAPTVNVLFEIEGPPSVQWSMTLFILEMPGDDVGEVLHYIVGEGLYYLPYLARYQGAVWML